jgi:hypothetical protein
MDNLGYGIGCATGISILSFGEVYVGNFSGLGGCDLTLSLFSSSLFYIGYEAYLST